MCITLLTGYIIAREEKDDTLKNILTVPVSYRLLLCGKLAAGSLLSLFLGIVSAVFTVIADLIVRFPGLSASLVLQAFIQIPCNCLFLYLAMLPVITAGVRIPNGHLISTIIAFVYGYGAMFASGDMRIANLYPVTASMGLIRYRSYDEAVNWNMPLCILSMFVMIVITGLLILTARQSAPGRQKRSRPVTKKGW